MGSTRPARPRHLRRKSQLWILDSLRLERRAASKSSVRLAFAIVLLSWFLPGSVPCPSSPSTHCTTTTNRLLSYSLSMSIVPRRAGPPSHTYPLYIRYSPPFLVSLSCLFLPWLSFLYFSPRRRLSYLAHYPPHPHSLFIFLFPSSYCITSTVHICAPRSLDHPSSPFLLSTVYPIIWHIGVYFLDYVPRYKIHRRPYIVTSYTIDILHKSYIRPTPRHVAVASDENILPVWLLNAWCRR